jgi:hypothetical protein
VRSHAGRADHGCRLSPRYLGKLVAQADRPPRGQRQAPQYEERDFVALLAGTHQLIKALIVLVWDRLNTHVSRTCER